MATASSVPHPLTGDNVIDAATHGYYWELDSSRIINWSLADGYFGEIWTSPSTVAAMLGSIFNNISSYADVHFNYEGYFTDPVTAQAGGSDITISLGGSGIFGSDTSTWAMGNLPDASLGVVDPGDIFVNTNSQATSLPSYAPGSAGYALFIHEIGHTLGLKHPHDDGGTGHPTFAQMGIPELDIDWYTVMSYNDDYSSLELFDPATPMVLDVLALQYLYGKNNTTNATNTTYTLIQNSMYQTIWDAGGTDVVDVSQSIVGWEIQLPTQNSALYSALVDTRVGYALPASEASLSSPFTLYWLMGDIENVTGSSFDDTLLGNELSNSLIGNAGNDILNGGAGTDTMAGGLGNDTYTVDVNTDVITEALNAGTDMVVASLNYTLGANVENLTLTGAALNGTGNALANVITGNALNNLLSGLAGSDQLIGGVGDDSLDGGAGTDTMAGGLGNDTYTVDVNTDVVTEALNAGTDTVFASFEYQLVGVTVENLTLTGPADIPGIGNALNNILIGNSGHNMLTGLAGNDQLIGGVGNDILDGGDGMDNMAGGVGNDTFDGGLGNDILDGGLGTDTMIGELGDDTYVVDVATDVVIEALNAGTDKVFASLNYTLGANVENLTLTGTAVIDGAGNTLNNVLTGNSASNTLTGGDGNDTLNGGVGSDTLVGGAGNDLYVVDVAGDVVTELAAEGTDKVFASLTYTLGANVENLTLTGTTAINGTGNTLNNVLMGNSASNTFTGGDGNDTLNGGVGSDTLVGGTGNDLYVVDVAGDVVTEVAAEGTDTVHSALTYTLGANVENLILTGTTVINGTGNTLNNVLTGNSAINTLTGGDGNDTLNGGVGSDTLVGGAGNDLYVVDVTGDVVTELAAEGTDKVFASRTYTLSANVENLTLTGTSAINGTGNTLNNVLTGNSVTNILTGGAGNDTYVVGILDVVTELAAEGTDTVHSALTYTLGANVENLILTGTTAINGTGNILNNVLTGNSAINTLTGGVGNDVYVVSTGDTVVENTNEGTDRIQSDVTWTLGANLENLTLTGTAPTTATGNTLNNTLLGNSAANVLTGGIGNDIYVVGAGDTVVENLAEGTDTVHSALTYTLGDNVENLTLTGALAINGTGNTLNNVLTGNSASNTLTGGIGNDTYVVSTGDVVTELAAEGTDTVQSALSYTLGANVENLTLTGAAVINGTGNTLNNLIIGNSAANVLTGGAGDDRYTVGVGDTVVENANEGVDLLWSGMTWTLGANIENLTLTGTGAINGTGNVLNNTLIGNSAANVLTGDVGNDTLRGGLGNDTYLVNRGDGQDTIQDADATVGNADRLLYGATINPLDLVLSRQVNDLRIALHGTSEQVTIQNWYTSPATNQVETIQAGNGQTLLSSQVDQLIQAMAQFSAANGGITWDLAIDQQPAAVQTVLAANGWS